MLKTLLLGSALLVGFPDAELQGIEAEIAQLEGERAKAGTFHDNDRRADIDRKLDLLRRVRNRAATAIDFRVQECIQAQKQAVPQANAPSPTARAAACLGAGSGVVSQVRRVEELRDQIRYGKWDWHNRDERAALQKELETLERLLGAR